MYTKNVNNDDNILKDPEINKENEIQQTTNNHESWNRGIYKKHKKNAIQPQANFFYKLKMFFYSFYGLFYSFAFMPIVAFLKRKKIKGSRQLKKISSQLKNLTKEYNIEQNKLFIKINDDNLLKYDTSKLGDVFKYFKEFSGCYLGHFINIEPKKNIAEFFLITCLGHAMCGYIDSSGKKYIIDNGGFSLSPTFWQKKDFIDNNIEYIKVDSGNKWCGLAALDNMSSICDIYKEMHKNGVNNECDFAKIKNPNILNQTKIMDAIKKDVSDFAIRNQNNNDTKENNIDTLVQQNNVAKFQNFVKEAYKKRQKSLSL